MLNIRAEYTRLSGLTVRQLREEFERVWREPTRSNNKVFLAKRIVWRLQAAAEGDLSERSRKRAEEIAADLDLRIRPDAQTHRTLAGVRLRSGKELPRAGTVIRRVYKGRTLEVTVLERGVRFEGVQFASLSALAKHITGSVWNGRRFFGLDGPTARKEQA